MAFSDYVGGTGWSGHKSPSSDITNPNNDPEIAASQARLRAIASFNFKASAPKLGAWTQGGEGTGGSWFRELSWDTPGGRVTATETKGPPDMSKITDAEFARLGQAPDANSPVNWGSFALSSAEKYWWQPGLAERFGASIGEDGLISKIQPRDTRQSFGQKLADAAGSFATIGAAGLAAYGLAAGLGAASTAIQSGGLSSITSGLGASDLAQAALAAAGLYTASQAGRNSGGTTSAAGSGTAPNITAPEAPPAPPMIEYQDFHAPFAEANAKANKNPTNLNPQGISNMLFASGNLLLGA